jgi:S1-C subfamily serine protease
MSLRFLAVMTLSALLAAAASAGAQTSSPSTRPYLGILAEPAPAGAAQAGVFVRSVTAGSPAARAGLKEGDEITRVDDREVKDFEDLVNTLARHKTGDKVTVQVRHEGREQSLAVTLGEHRQPRPGLPGRPTAFLGVATRPLTSADKQRLGVAANEGVVVVEVVANTPAAQAGLRPDDVITAVDGKAVASPADLREWLSEAGADKEVGLTVQHGQETRQVKARLEESPADAFTPPALDERGALRRLERRLDRLEKRVQELEQKSRPDLSK